MKELFWHPKIGFKHLYLLKRNSGLGIHKIKQHFLAHNKHTLIMVEDVKITFACKFNFENYPFDNQECDLTYNSEVGDKNAIILNTTKYVGTNTADGIKVIYSPTKKKLIIPNTTTPFIVSVEIEPNKTVYAFSATSIKINLQRNSIALLMGSFYAPTGIFAVMSMASYVINPDIVSLNYQF